jgi:hypothetical protein
MATASLSLSLTQANKPNSSTAEQISVVLPANTGKQPIAVV